MENLEELRHFIRLLKKENAELKAQLNIKRECVHLEFRPKPFSKGSKIVPEK